MHYFDIFVWVIYTALFIVALFYDFIFPYYIFRKGDFINIGSYGSQCKVIKVKKASKGMITVSVKPINGSIFKITINNK